MLKNKLTEKQIQTRVIMRIIALIYIYSFFLPTLEYYGPVYGYRLVLTPFIILTLIPNIIVIITFFRYRKFKFSLKIVLAVIVILSSCIWWLVDINTHYPLIDYLLIGYWVWLISCFLIMLVPLFNSENKK
jgi:hypothetical protein